mmetsp:Transcript_31312/g.50266  ORF Transcript_31312/g.50266 Transcript_31312/m.50266 type:complete len:416 (-) Transcript_31312:140-1387(-)
MANFDQERYNKELHEFEEMLSNKVERSIPMAVSQLQQLNSLSQRAPTPVQQVQQQFFQMNHVQQPSSDFIPQSNSHPERKFPTKRNIHALTPSEVKSPQSPPVITSSSGLPMYLQDPKMLLTGAINQRLQLFKACSADDTHNHLDQMDKLLREINICRDQLNRTGPEGFEALVISLRGTKKMREALVPSIIVSITAFSFLPVVELTGKIFEVELTWRKGDIRCSTRAVLAMGNGTRGELVLGTLREMTGNHGMCINVRFVRFLRHSNLNDNVQCTRNQIMLDLWSMGLYQFADGSAPQQSLPQVPSMTLGGVVASNPLVGKSNNSTPPIGLTNNRQRPSKRPRPLPLDTAAAVAAAAEAAQKKVEGKTVKCCACGKPAENGIDLFEIGSQEVCCSQECRDAKEKELLDAFVAGLM